MDLLVTGVPVSDARGLALLRAIRRDPLATFTDARRHGPIVRMRVPRVPVYLVSDPDAVREALTLTHRGYAKGFARRGDPAGPVVEPLRRVLGDGLLTSDPALHRRQRRLIQPLFHTARIAGYADTFVALTAAHLRTWRGGEARDLHRDLTELTLTIVARTVFDADLDSAAMHTIRGAVATDQSTLRREAVPWGRMLDRLPLPATRRWRRDRQALDTVVAGLIADRRSAADPGTDLLSLLLSARTDDGRPMTDDLVRDEALTLLLAGHETTANALAWTLHLLGDHRQVQARLHDELDAVLRDRPPTVTDIPHLPYTRAVIRESMRLYPPAWIILRRLTEHREVCGHRLPAGATLILSPWVVHRDPQWWPEPERFQPDRWLTTDPARPAHAYFPFGGGPRQCIGNAFAELEAQLVLATMCQRWSFTPAPGKPPAQPQPLVTLRPRHGVHLTLHTRSLVGEGFAEGEPGRSPGGGQGGRGGADDGEYEPGGQPARGQLQG